MQESLQARAARLIAELWQRSQPQVRERVDLLEAAAESSRSGTLTIQQRADAEATAHKLAGSLGMFGFPRGTDLARAFEQEIRKPAPDPAELSHLVSSLRSTLFPPS